MDYNQQIRETINQAVQKAASDGVKVSVTFEDKSSGKEFHTADNGDSYGPYDFNRDITIKVETTGII